MPLRHFQLVAVFHGLDDLIDIGEIQFWINALCVQIESDRNQAAVARTLAIAEQAAFDAVRAGHQPQFRRGDAGAPVVVCVQADYRAFAIGQVATEILDLVGIDVRRRRLDRGRQIEDDGIFRRRPQDPHHRFAAFDREIEFGGGEGLGRIFEMPLRLRIFRRLVAQHFGTALGDPADLRLLHPEHDLAPERRNRIVEVDDGGMDPGQALETAFDEVLPRLGEHLHQDVIGNAAGIDQAPDEIELGSAGAGEADFDFLEAYLDQQIEEARLLFRAHRIDQRLVAIAQVGGEPAGGLGDGLGGPAAIGQLDLRKRPVLDRRVLQHGHRISLARIKSAGRFRGSLGRRARRRQATRQLTPKGV